VAQASQAHGFRFCLIWTCIAEMAPPVAYDIADMARLKHVEEMWQISREPMYAGDRALQHQALPCDLPHKVTLQSVTCSLMLAHGDVLAHNKGLNPTQTPCREKEVKVGKCIGVVEVPMHNKEITPTPTYCREKQVQVGKSIIEDKQEMTSLVVRNLPGSCTQEDLMMQWPNHDGAIDLLYMPRKTKDQIQNIAFINFTSNAAAHAFRSCWHGQQLSHGVGDPTTRLNVGFAKVQGQAAILSLLKKRRVGRMQRQYQPILFQQGVRMSLGNTLVAAWKQKTAESECCNLSIEPFQFGVLYSL